MRVIFAMTRNPPGQRIALVTRLSLKTIPPHQETTLMTEKMSHVCLKSDQEAFTNSSVRVSIFQPIASTLLKRPLSIQVMITKVLTANILTTRYEKLIFPNYFTTVKIIYYFCNDKFTNLLDKA